MNGRREGKHQQVYRMLMYALRNEGIVEIRAGSVEALNAILRPHFPDVDSQHKTTHLLGVHVVYDDDIQDNCVYLVDQDGRRSHVFVVYIPTKNDARTFAKVRNWVWDYYKRKQIAHKKRVDNC